MGGMAAQIPIKNDPEANEAALAKVRADKEREARDGHDGTWVAHPGLVGLARDIFDKHMPTPNQIFRKREDVQDVYKRQPIYSLTKRAFGHIQINAPGCARRNGVRISPGHDGFSTAFRHLSTCESKVSRPRRGGPEAG